MCSGFNFLTYLETLVGGEEVMNKYLRAHCEKYAHSTVNSGQFKEFFLGYMSEVAKVPADTLAQIDWEAWYNKPGMPVQQNAFDQTLIKDSEALAQVLLEGSGEATAKVTKDSIRGWDSAQIVILLEAIIDAQKKASAAGEPKDVAAFAEKLQAIDRTFDFTLSKNSEVRFRWLTVSLTNNKRRGKQIQRRVRLRQSTRELSLTRLVFCASCVRCFAFAPSCASVSRSLIAIPPWRLSCASKVA